MKKRILSLALCLALALSLAACSSGGQGEQTPDTQPSASPSPSDQSTPEPSQSGSGGELETVRFAVLSGPTGVGAAKLMADNEAGQTQGKYEVTVAADNNEISGKLTNGDLDIAAMASNVAANLYNKSEGGVQALCLSTLGVLYILERGDAGAEPTITSLADLAGKTLYATGEGANPQYVLNYLLTENGLDPASDVEIIWQTAEEVQAGLLTGDAQYAMLPVPAATAVEIKSKTDSAAGRNVEAVLDLTDEWNKVTNTGVLTMTTVVVRTEFAQEHPEVMEALAADYKASVEAACNDLETTAALCEEYGIVASAAIAQKALPACNIVYMDGEEMKEALELYLQVLYDADPASVGGALPGDDFYLAAS